MGGLHKFIERVSAIFFGAVFLCFSGGLYAQDKAVFRHFEKKDGLSQGSVFAITQDAEGYIWMGTRDGLNKYDGYQFTVYRNDPEQPGTIGGNDIRTLYFDSLASTIWLSNFKGLSKYDAKVDTFHNYTLEDGLSSELVQDILRDSKGRLWLGMNNGLNLYQSDKDQFVKVPLDIPGGEAMNVQVVFEADNGDLLLGMPHGIYRLKVTKDGKYKVRPFLSRYRDDLSVPNYDVQSIIRDDEGQLWVGTQGGVFRYNPKNQGLKLYGYDSNDPHSLSNNSVRALAKSPDGDIWIGTWGGLNKYIPEKDHFQRFVKEDLNAGSLSNNSIWSIFFDHSGGLWLGTYHGGANYHDPAFNRFENYEHLPDENSLSHNVISSFAEDEKGNFWIGTEGGGLNYFNRAAGAFKTYLADSGQNGVSGNSVKCLLKDGDKLWIGTFRQGISCLNLSDMSFRHIKNTPASPNLLTDNDVYSLLKEGDKLWALTYGGGLNVIDLKSNKVQAYQYDPADTTSISSNNGRIILKDSRHRLWVGTESGLNLILRDSINDYDLSFRRFLGDFKIYSLYEDKSGILWIGTFSNGLFAFNPYDQTFRHYTEKDGLPGLTIFGILQDRTGKLWLSTNNGLSKMDIQGGVFTNYNYADGLQNLEFNYNAYYKAQSGELLFGGTNGFTLFQPSEILNSQFIPPLVFTDLEVYNRKVRVLDDNSVLDKVLNEVGDLTFKYNEAIFSIGLAALDYSNPGNIKYAYKLEGLDNDWNYTVGQTRAGYTIQRPGTYLFKVKATNSDGIWKEEERQLRIKVLPPPWRSIWAYIIYAFLLAGAIYGAWFFIRLKNRLHLERLAKQQQKELNEMKLRFFTDITHEFRTPLTLILGPLDEMLQKYTSNGIHGQLQSVKRNAERMLNLVNQILTFRKLEADHDPVRAARGDIVAFTGEIFRFFEETAQMRDIKYIFHSPEAELSAWFDAEKLEKVFFNLLSNAFKFTPDKGVISVIMRKKRESVEISVSDNGNGIKKDLHEQIFKRYYEKVAIPLSKRKGTGIGLALSKQMVELHQGKLWVESEVGKGTTFFVEIPLGKEHFQTSEISDTEINPKNVLLQENRPVVEAPDFSWLAESTEKSPSDAPLILVVEDNEEVRQYLQSIFQKTYRIETAINGVEGLAKAKKLNPELIISDIMMPKMDGMAMCEKLKTDVKTSHIPIILLTARSAQVLKNEGLQTGADDYVTKPFNPEEMRLRVRNIIRNRETMREKFVRVMNLEPKEITVTSADEDFLKRALEVAEKNIDNSNFTAEQFAYALAVSRPLLFTKVKALTNQTPNNFMKTLRMKRAAQLLETQKLNVSEVAYKVGFKDTRYFSKCFQKHFNQTPSEYMNR
ncbi:MAG TPA: two-component regulator propeller domain-containing protein [Saprospiraceae bacterium]|nr:two-component regulator propeller domain-containing protein [Saprospiraceae bacterium]